MDRREFILKYITKEMRGVEIGPWMSPLAPKREGFNCLVMDVFDTVTLRQRLSEIPSLASNILDIEDVDLIGSSTHIDELVNERSPGEHFDYIVSSHNFEHLSNPLRFLQGCARVLKPGGVISMAIPDHRGCFDIFRPVTRLSDWIEAFSSNRSSPTFAQVFDDSWAYAHFQEPPNGQIAFPQSSPLGQMVTTTARFEDIYSEWKSAHAQSTEDYRDAHCSVFTPSSFTLLISDAAYLGLTDFEVIETHDTGSYEFYVHLRLRPAESKMRSVNYAAIRSELFRQIRREESASLVAVERAESQNKHDSTCNTLAQTEAELRSAYEKIARLETSIQELRASSSWRVTAPIRRVVTAMKR